MRRLIIDHLGSKELAMWQRQAWRLALGKIQSAPTKPRPVAAIDLDGTVFCHDVYNEWLVSRGKEFPAGWDGYCLQILPDLVPGAELLVEMSSMCRIIYVTRRDENLRDVTMHHIAGRHLPHGEHLLMVPDGTSKSHAVEQYLAESPGPLVVAVGDQIEDMLESDTVGVMVPNPVYGSWTQEEEAK